MTLRFFLAKSHEKSCRNPLIQQENQWMRLYLQLDNACTEYLSGRRILSDKSPEDIEHIIELLRSNETFIEKGVELLKRYFDVSEQSVLETIIKEATSPLRPSF